MQNCEYCGFAIDQVFCKNCFNILCILGDKKEAFSSLLKYQVPGSKAARGSKRIIAAIDKQVEMIVAAREDRRAAGL